MIRKRDQYTKISSRNSRTKYLMPFYSIVDMYRYFRKSIKDKKKENKDYNIHYKQYRDILDYYNKQLIEELVSGREVKIPNFMGTLVIRKKFIPIDMYTEACRKTMFASGKWIFRVKFIKTKYKLRNLNYYSYRIPYRTILRIQKIFNDPDGHKNYFEI